MKESRPTQSKHKVMPPEQRLWWLWYLAIPAVCTYGLVTGRGGYRGFFGGSHNMDPETTRILCYLMLGLWLTHVILAVVSRTGRRDWTTCGTLLVAFACVNGAQILAYLAFRPFHPALLFPLVYVIPVLLIVGASAVLKRGQLLTPERHRCARCDMPARFTLSSRAQGGRDRNELYCLQHMMEELSTFLQHYDGHFVITDRQATDIKSGQYYFYSIGALADDSYPESDIEAVKSLLSRVSSDYPNVHAVRIPAEAVKDIGQFDEAPLFAQQPSEIAMVPLTDSDLLAHLESTLAIYDNKGCEFLMNKPYASEGIFLWHSYI